MTEVVFPLLGAAFVLLVVLPAVSLLAKAALLLLERDEAGGPLHGLPLRYLVLTGSSALPLAWFLSAGLHQAESGESALACLFEHAEAALCFEPGLFALTLILLGLALAARPLRGAARSRTARVVHEGALVDRVARLVAAHRELRGLEGRIAVTDEPGFAVGTHGLLRRTVLVGSGFAAAVSDDMLASALGHEAEHVRAFDPLRYLVLRVALAVNPLGRFLLEPHATRWLAAREAHCDREAVVHGAAPLPLADAIVRAARPTAGELVALGAHDARMLRFRVGMLLAFAERPPQRCCPREGSALPVATLLVLVALLLPHQTGTAALDAVHSGVERALHHVLP